MKKLILAALTALLFVPASGAGLNGIETGDNHIFLLGGRVFAEKNNFEYSGGGEISVIMDGFAGGAQYLRYVSPHIGLGVEVSGAKYGSAYGYDSAVISGQHIYIDMQNSSERYNLLFVVKANINPADRVRVYPVLGVGLNWFKYKSAITAHNVTLNLTNKETVENNDFLPGGYLGLGLEADLTELITLGIEGRYDAFMFDKNREGTKNSYLTDMSVVAKLGFKF